MADHTATTVAAGLTVSKLAVGINLLLAVGKIVTGVLGNSYALIADGIESTADVDGNLRVWQGHEIGHQVKDRLLASPHRIGDVTVHVEPSEYSPIARKE